MKSSFSEAKQTSNESIRFLHNGPYALLEMQETLSWTAEVWEQWWLGRTTDEQVQRLLVCEVCVPGGSLALTTIIQPAIARLMHVSQHPQMPALLNVLSERGHAFFVFEWPGESLVTTLRQLDRPLTFQEVMPGCLHLLELLRWLAAQQPAIIHGTICPEHIHVTKNGHWILSHCSILLTTKAVPASAPTWTRGTQPLEKQEEQESDLAALMASMLFALTGQRHASTKTQLTHLSQHDSASADVVMALFTRALHPVASLRATHPEELLPLVTSLIQQETLHNPIQRTQGRKEPLIRQADPAIAGATRASSVVSLQQAATQPLPREQMGLLPRSENLPPLPPGQDGWAAFVWTCQILFCLACLFLLSS